MKMLLALLLIFSTQLSARSAPAEWDEFIKDTDLVVKGTIIQQKLVPDPDDDRFSDIEYTVEIVDKIDLSNKSLTPGNEIRFIYYPQGYAYVGNAGYFFLTFYNGKWWAADFNAGAWMLNGSQFPKARKYQEGDKLEIFPYGLNYLGNMPKALYDEHTAPGEKFPERRYTEEKLIKYLRSIAVK